MNLYTNDSDETPFAGSLFGMNPKSVVSYPASATVAFGKGVFLTNGKVSNAKGTSGVFVGAALFHQCEAGEYEAKDAVACINDGNVWVVLDSDIEPTDGASAYVTSAGVFTTASEGNTLVGKFKSAADNGIALVDLSK